MWLMPYSLLKRLKLSPEYCGPLSDLICFGTLNKLTASSMNCVTAADVTGAGISWIGGTWRSNQIG